MRRPGPRPLMALVVTVLLAATVPGCSRAGKVEGEGRLDPKGRVVLTRDDHPATVSGSRSLVAGDTVEVSEGTAKVTMPGGDVLELRPRSVLVFDRGPELRSGTILVGTANGSRTVRVAGNQIDANGATRIDVAPALRVLAYAGHAIVHSSGRTLDVPALREASVPVIGVLRGPQPLLIDPQDVWDQRYFGEAASKEAELEDLARGFAGLVSTADATSLAFYRGILPGLRDQPDFQQAQVDRLGRAAFASTERAGTGRFQAGDVLVGTAIALQGKRGTFAERMVAAADFRTDGASWALVSLDQRVPSIADLLGLIRGAINGSPLELAMPGSGAAAPPAQAAPTRAAPTTTPGTPRAPASPTSTAPARTTPTTTPAQARQPQPQTPPTLVLPVDPLLDAVVDPVAKLLNDLLGAKRPT